MPKNSQYGRWRRAAMQAVMWVVFGGTLALAGYVSHQRTAPLAADPGEPVSFGRLQVRLPKGWEREPFVLKGQYVALIAREHDEEGRQRREMWVTQEQQGLVKRGPAYYLETAFKLPDARIEPFPMLGNRGVVIAWRGIPQQFLQEMDESVAEHVPPPGLYACTVLPDGLTVTLQLHGEGAYGPSNLRLMRNVADTLKLSDNPTPLPTAANNEE